MQKEIENIEQAVERVDENFIERIDKIREALMSPRRMVELNNNDFNLCQSLIESNHILTNPNIPKTKEIGLIATMLNCSITYAKTIKKSHQILFEDTKAINREFKRNVVAQRFWEMAEEAKSEGDRNEEAIYLEKYYIVLGLHKADTNVDPPRALPVPVFTTNPNVLEIESNE